MENMKRGLLISFLLILFINFVNAQFFSGFGQISLSNFLENIGAENLTLFALFLIFFPIIFYALGKIFKDSYGEPNRGIAGVIAFGVSTLIVYSIYKSGFDVNGLFSGWGMGEGLLYSIIPILFIAFIIFGIFKRWFKLSGLLICAGLFLIILNMFTDIFYEKTTIFMIGFVLLLIGLGIMWFKRGGRLHGGTLGRGALQGIKRKPLWTIALLGIILLVIGFVFNQIYIIIAGIILTLIGFFGKKAYSETFATGRNMSVRRAREEAYKEKAKRDSAARKLWIKRCYEVQRLYNRQKSIYQDRSLPAPTIKAAANEMQRLISYANKEGLHLRP